MNSGDIGLTVEGEYERPGWKEHCPRPGLNEHPTCEHPASYHDEDRICSKCLAEPAAKFRPCAWAAWWEAFWRGIEAELGKPYDGHTSDKRQFGKWYVELDALNDDGLVTVRVFPAPSMMSVHEQLLSFDTEPFTWRTTSVNTVITKALERYRDRTNT